jgi:8-oxo-dGTP diphosphatase
MKLQPENQPDDTPVRAGIALVHRRGCYLVRQRPPGSIYAGYWEFPGGKCEPGEGSVHATIRECHEETGLVVVADRLRSTTTHRYAHGLVQLFFYDCTPLDVLAEPDTGSGFEWVPIGEIASLKFPEANDSVIAELVAQKRGD